MNIHAKLQAVKVELAALNLKKSGKQQGRAYYELADFLPQVNVLLQKHNMSTSISFTQESAILTLTDADEPQSAIQSASPMSTAKLAGCHEVQNLGAVQTYLRRYLYMNMFDIVEADALDADPAVGKPGNVKPEVKSSEKDGESTRLYNKVMDTAKAKGLIVDIAGKPNYDKFTPIMDVLKLEKRVTHDAAHWTALEMQEILAELTKEVL